MSKFLTTTASATFFGNSLYTPRITNDIWSTRPDPTGDVCRGAGDSIGEGRGVGHLQLGRNFRKALTAAYEPGGRAEPHCIECPKVVHMMTSDDPIAQVSLQFDGWEWLHGLGMEVKPSAPYRNVFDLLGSKGIENAVCKVHNYSISIYA